MSSKFRLMSFSLPAGMRKITFSVFAFCSHLITVGSDFPVFCITL